MLLFKGYEKIEKKAFCSESSNSEKAFVLIILSQFGDISIDNVITDMNITSNNVVDQRQYNIIIDLKY